MARTRALHHAFNVGELSSAGMARIDQARTRLGAEVQENILPYVVGKGLVRPGTLYVDNASGNNRARLIPFIKSVNDTAIVEMTDAKMRVMVSDAFITRPSVTSSVSDGTFATASTNHTSGSTVTASSTVSGAASNLTDGSFSTGWASSVSPTQWLSFDLGSAKTIRLIKIVSSSKDRNPTAFTVSGSNTGAFAGEQTTLYTLSGGDADTYNAQENYYALTSPGSYRYYRINMTANPLSAAYALVIVEMYDTPWVFESAGYGTFSISGGAMTLCGETRGGWIKAKQQVSTSSSGTEHALRIAITRGPITFRCGSSDGADDYISSTTLDTGEHSLAFTPSGASYYIEFYTNLVRDVIVGSIAVEAAGELEFDAPWSESQLRDIRHDQSGDIIFLAHASWQQRKIERRATRSWSLVKYYSDDGPFLYASSGGVKLTPGAAWGNTTLTASEPVFAATDVGSLIRINTRGDTASYRLAGRDQWTEPVRILGVGDANIYDVTRAGSWTGTVVLQRSFDGDDAGFRTKGTDTWTANGVESINPGDGLDNVEHWVRVGFEPYPGTWGDYTGGWADLSVSFGGQVDYGIFRITGFTSSTEVAVEVLRPCRNLTANDSWYRAAWSDRRGWPSSVRFYDGRLWWAAIDRFWASISDNYYSYDLDADKGEAGSIQRSVATGGAINRVQWMLPLQRLIFGTEGAEVSARSSNFDAPMTPTDITLRDASTLGCAPITPAKMDSRGLFVQRSGHDVYELVYDYNSNDYGAKNLTRLNEDIGGTGEGFVELAVARQPEPWIWLVRDDGEVPVMLYSPNEEVAGFCRYIAAASSAGAAVVESVCILPGDNEDAVYLSVKRTIDGSVVRTIEKLGSTRRAVGGAITYTSDCAVYNAGPVTTFTGLDHLEGEEVVAWGNSKPLGTYTVSGGQITLSESATSVTVGLSYTWRYKTAKLAYGSGDGTALLRKKIINEFGILLENTHVDAVTYGPDFDRMRQIPRIKDGTTVTADDVLDVYDEVVFAFPGQWDTDARVCLKGTSPYPCTLLGLVIIVNTSEGG